jgi:uncharacterized protein YbjT (DUF2867 family)
MEKASQMIALSGKKSFHVNLLFDTICLRVFFGEDINKKAISMRNKPVLVTGATGYVGRRLVKKILEAGYRVRAAVRSPEKFKGRYQQWPSNLEVVYADLLDLESITLAAHGCFAAYYLVHSLTSTRDFSSLEKQSAKNMVLAAENAGLARIIYLGGLGREDAGLSKHLLSRYEVGSILKRGRVPVTILRAAIILGSGSAAFEIIRYLSERLPVIFAPDQIYTRCQPICIRNVLEYLVGCLDNEDTIGQTYDIGGPDLLSYTELINIYCKQAGLKPRPIITISFLSLRMASYLASLITPVPETLVSALMEGLQNEVVCSENQIRELIPQNLITCEEAIRRALEKVDQQIVDTYYHDAGNSIPPEWADKSETSYSGGQIVEASYQIHIQASCQQVWEPIKHIGGKTGWYFGGSLWWLRGIVDKLVGGVGLQRGRRHPEDIAVGDSLDCWRVLDVKPPNRLLLLAEMRLPGEAILEFYLSQISSHETELTMNARFLAKGLTGMGYWYAIYPFHDYVFKGMLQNIASACQAPVSYGPEKINPGH